MGMDSLIAGCAFFEIHWFSVGLNCNHKSCTYRMVGLEPTPPPCDGRFASNYTTNNFVLYRRTCQVLGKMAPRRGFEPRTATLTVWSSTAELTRNKKLDALF